MIYLWFFILGACIGSFILVVINRYINNKKKELFLGRSRCDSCGKILQAPDLIPIASFLIFGGKCRYCHKKINPEHFYIELFFGILAVTTYYIQSNLLLALLSFVVMAILFILAAIDRKQQEIPTDIALIGLIIALIYQIILGSSLVTIAISTFAGAILFIILVVISKETWMGSGDIWVGGLLGLWLGSLVYVALFFAFVLGSLFGIYLLYIKHVSRKTSIPLVPFLALGGYIAFFWGANMLQWYLGG